MIPRYSHDPRDVRIIDQHGYRMIEGSSEAPYTDEHSRLNKKALEYAIKYNGMLLRYLRSHKDI